MLGEVVTPGHGVNVQEVLDNLPTASILHLACHGEQDAIDPLRSGFCLRNGRLAIGELMKINLRHAFFAFLSACETAKGDSKQPDQAVHLAAAILFVGFRSVIATIWCVSQVFRQAVGRLLTIMASRSMNDEDGPTVAKIVYRALVKEEFLDPDVFPYALDTAVRKLRDGGAQPHRWAPYIHMGA